MHRHPTLRAHALCTLFTVCSGCATAGTLQPAGGFTQTLGRAHPLVGVIWNVSAHAASTPDALRSALAQARYAVLGETHDNRDQHLLQAELTGAFLAAHPGAVVAFEMLDEDQAPQLRAGPLRDADALAERVHWSETGWPAFELYRPLVAIALQAGATIVAAHPSAEHVRASLHGVSDDEARALHLEPPLPPDQLAAQAEEIRAGHCGHAPAAMVTAMQRAQSYKDAFMARALYSTGKPALLIAGRGHARNDRAVPVFLRRAGASAILSVAFMDVDDAHTRAADYDIGAFDYVVFTPRVTDEDPCQRFRQQLETMHAHPAEP